MKRLFTILTVCALLATTAGARGVDVESSEFYDNFSIGISGGLYTPMANHAFFGSMRPMFGLTVAKQFTPVYGLGIEGMTSVNTKKIGVYSANGLDVLTLNLLHYFNLTNIICGYQGKSRFVEVVAFWGLGWGHAFIHRGYVEDNDPSCADRNFLSSKAGLSINFNLGESRAWQINIKPAVAWNINGDSQFTNSGLEYNVNYSAFELQAGVTYKFKNSNGTHEFKEVRPYDQGEIDALNAKINGLRADVDRLNGENGRKDAAIKDLQDQLNDCRNSKPAPVVEPAKVDKELEVNVFFRQGKSSIESSQLPNVERIATYMKHHPESKVVIKGYASPEGSAEINERLAKERAEAVKKSLISKYKIDESRITASGEGVGNMFSEPDWNRVSISTIQK